MDTTAGEAWGGFFVLLTVAFFVSILPAIIAGKIWGNKGGSSGVGGVMGLLLGWIGVIIAAVATPSRAAQFSGGAVAGPSGPVRECPHCKEQMRRDASVCPHCQRDSDAWVFHEGRW